MGNETADDLRQITSEDVPDPSSLPLDLSATPVDLSASRPRSLAIQPNLSSGNATSLTADLPPVQVFFIPWEKSVVDEDLEESDLKCEVRFQFV